GWCRASSAPPRRECRCRGCVPPRAPAPPRSPPMTGVRGRWWAPAPAAWRRPRRPCAACACETEETRFVGRRAAATADSHPPDLPVLVDREEEQGRTRTPVRAVPVLVGPLAERRAQYRAATQRARPLPHRAGSAQRLLLDGAWRRGGAVLGASARGQEVTVQ